MENALAVFNIKELENVGKKYTRIYYGNEFCPHLLFRHEEIKRVLEFCYENDKQLTLVTPYLSEGRVEQVGNILEYLKNNNISSELVVNDWGLLFFINTYYKDVFNLELGPLLNKIKKSPIVMNYIDKMSAEGRDMLKTSSCNLAPTWGILNKFNIKRIQFENVLHENKIDSKLPFERSLKYPFVFITTARRCVTSLILQDLENYELTRCGRPCINTNLGLYNKIMGREITLKGNTYYYRNDNLPENINEFSRIIWNFNLTKY